MRRILLLLSALLLTLGTNAVVAAPAQAAWCGYNGANPSMELFIVTANGVNYRTGPFLSCGTNGQWNNGTRVYVHCWDTGSTVVANGYYSSVWYHVRRQDTQQQGWVSELYMRREWVSGPLGPPDSHYAC